MADMKTGVFAKNVQKRLNRAQEKVLQKLGKADETKDEQFEEFVQNFKKQEMEGSRLQREMKTYLTAVKGLQQASMNLTQSLHEVYEPEWYGMDDVMSIGKDCDALWEDFHQKLVDSSLITLDTYLAQFPDIKIRIAKRSRKLIDYDSARHHLETLQAANIKNDRKISKAEEEFNKAQKVFEELNIDLQEELPCLWDSRVGFYVNTFKNVTNLETKFHKEISALCHKLYEVMTKLGEQHADKAFTIQGAPSDTGPLRLTRTPSPPDDESPPGSPTTSPNHMLAVLSAGPPRPKSPLQLKKGPPVPPPPKLTPARELAQEQIINLFDDNFVPECPVSVPTQDEKASESLLDLDFDPFKPDTNSVVGQSQTSMSQILPWDLWTASTGPTENLDSILLCNLAEHENIINQTVKILEEPSPFLAGENRVLHLQNIVCSRHPDQEVLIGTNCFGVEWKETEQGAESLHKCQELFMYDAAKPEVETCFNVFSEVDPAEIEMRREGSLKIIKGAIDAQEDELNIQETLLENKLELDVCQVVKMLESNGEECLFNDLETSDKAKLHMEQAVGSLPLKDAQETINTGVHEKDKHSNYDHHSSLDKRGDPECSSNLTQVVNDSFASTDMSTYNEPHAHDDQVFGLAFDPFVDSKSEESIRGAESHFTSDDIYLWPESLGVTTGCEDQDFLSSEQQASNSVQSSRFSMSNSVQGIMNNQNSLMENDQEGENTAVKLEDTTNAESADPKDPLCASTVCSAQTSANTSFESNKDTENSSDLSEDEVANRRYGWLYQEVDAEKVSSDVFNGFSQVEMGSSVFATDPLQSCFTQEGHPADAEMPFSPCNHKPVSEAAPPGDEMVVLAEPVPKPSQVQESPDTTSSVVKTNPDVEKAADFAEGGVTEPTCLQSDGPEETTSAEEREGSPTDTAIVAPEVEDESINDINEGSVAKEEKMPIPSVVIEPASSNEGDDDRDIDLTSPTDISDSVMTPDSQPSKDAPESTETFSKSNGIQGLPTGFLYKVETLHDFEAANTDELDIKRGDVVLVISTETVDQDAGWLTGIKESEWIQKGDAACRGLFPQSFTQRLE